MSGAQGDAGEPAYRGVKHGLAWEPAPLSRTGTLQFRGPECRPSGAFETKELPATAPNHSGPVTP